MGSRGLVPTLKTHNFSPVRIFYKDPNSRSAGVYKFFRTFSQVANFYKPNEGYLLLRLILVWTSGYEGYWSEIYFRMCFSVRPVFSHYVFCGTFFSSEAVSAVFLGRISCSISFSLFPLFVNFVLNTVFSRNIFSKKIIFFYL